MSLMRRFIDISKKLNEAIDDPAFQKMMGQVAPDQDIVDWNRFTKSVISTMDHWELTPTEHTDTTLMFVFPIYREGGKVYDALVIENKGESFLYAYLFDNGLPDVLYEDELPMTINNIHLMMDKVGEITGKRSS